jgi:hypothetical protein
MYVLTLFFDYFFHDFNIQAIAKSQEVNEMNEEMVD